MGEASVIVSSAQVEGEVTLGEDNVVQPLALIKAVNGPVVIGTGNVFEERCVIKNNLPLQEDGSRPTLVIGDDNHFEAGCQVFAKSVGSGNRIRANAILAPMCDVGSHCVVTAGKHVGAGVQLRDYSVVYGASGEMRSSEAPHEAADELRLLRDFLRKTLPMYHKCREAP
eukprot:TRINITY_DN25138_c0_g1_i1.p2 TRINITY_DN25138_c0_g1~~TRINITY_DN25138_c0_g1_i1.p2  ORF type:complete len:200 (+),score=68.33 TRINITY_DN25138_c0_g1_i1:92-601(+)